jgi:hypothetical protein
VPGSGAFALLARGGRGARPRFLAHCRSVQPDERSGWHEPRYLKGLPGLSNLGGMRG